MVSGLIDKKGSKYKGMKQAGSKPEASLTCYRTAKEYRKGIIFAIPNSWQQKLSVLVPQGRLYFLL